MKQTPQKMMALQHGLVVMLMGLSPLMLMGCGGSEPPKAGPAANGSANPSRPTAPLTNGAGTSNRPANANSNAQRPTNSTTTHAANSATPNTNATATTNANKPAPTPKVNQLPVRYKPLNIADSAQLGSYLNAGSFDLGIAMVLLAKHHFGATFNVQAAAQQLNDLAKATADDLGVFTDAPTLRLRLSTVFSQRLGLQFVRTDDEASRTDIDLLMLPAVIEKRRGNCMSFSVLVLAILDRLGLGDLWQALYLPGHVLLRYSGPGGEFLFETSGMMADYTIEQLAELRGLKWPPQADSPFGVPLNRRETFSLALNNYGVVLAALDRHEEAIAWHTEALKLWPTNGQSLQNLGCEKAEVARHLKRDDPKRGQLLYEAQTHVERAKTLWADNPEIYLHLARIHQLRGSTAEALAALAQGWRLVKATDFEPRWLKARILLEANRGAEAVEALKEAEPLLPKSPQLAAEFGVAQFRALAQTKQPAAALAKLKDVLAKMSPADRGDSLSDAAWESHKAKQFDVARGVLELYLDWQKANPTDAKRKKDLADLLHNHAALQLPQTETSATVRASVIWAYTECARFDDAFDLRFNVASLLMLDKHYDVAAQHLDKAHGLAKTPADKWKALELWVRCVAQAEPVDTKKIRDVVKLMKDVNDPTCQTEALFYEAYVMIIEAKGQIAPSQATAILKILDEYVKRGGKNENALRWREQLRK